MPTLPITEIDNYLTLRDFILKQNKNIRELEESEKERILLHLYLIIKKVAIDANVSYPSLIQFFKSSLSKNLNKKA